MPKAAPPNGGAILEWPETGLFQRLLEDAGQSTLLGGGRSGRPVR